MNSSWRLPSFSHLSWSPLGGRDPDAYVTPFCARASDDALRLFGRALNRYAAKGDNTLWIITEADRSRVTNTVQRGDNETAT
jgi:hypothetical protein